MRAFGAETGNFCGVAELRGAVMKRYLYVLLQCTWGAPQSLVGAVLYLLHWRSQHLNFHGAAATLWEYRSSVSLGVFVFAAKETYFNEKINREHSQKELTERLLVHEYGHTIQSLILGPLYLIVIGLPSLLWAGLPIFAKKRRDRGISYYSLYTEKWADSLGEAVTRKPSLGRLDIGQ